MWELYDELIEGISPDATADDFASGTSGSYVRSGTTVGLAGTTSETWREPILAKKRIGMPLRELAGCVKSWFNEEAALGLAAINAWYNNITRLRALGIDISDTAHVEDRSADPFIALQREEKGKNVTTIGHFRYIERLIAPVCNLSIVEKFNPQEGNYPEQAADYLLPKSDFVFIATYTIVEKTLPRLLALSGAAHVILVGPSTPVTPILHSYGVNTIGGFVVKNNEDARNICLGFGGRIYSTGQKIIYQAKENRI
jgi:uncharacterized protein (DUF4213/DUF364 family)